MNIMTNQLGGCTIGIQFADKRTMFKAVVQLSTCIKHGGQHHFAVTDDGNTVWMSTTGRECVTRVIDATPHEEMTMDAFE